MSQRERLSAAARIRSGCEELLVASVGWIPTPLGMAARLALWRWFFANCGAARFGSGLTISGMGNISLGNGCRIGRLAFLTANSGKMILGDNVSVSPCAHLSADNGYIEVGAKTAIGPGVVIRAANHAFDRLDAPIMDQGHTPGQVIIGEDVWIGANCVITPDTRVGKGAVVGAGAVVTRNVAPFSIVAGVPAREIGMRK
ncbi:MAG: acyltransferase [Desulfovibrio sp.]|nr:acyltransferase [Desulfovibrio sp.]